jgi:hypothetical protein
MVKVQNSVSYTPSTEAFRKTLILFVCMLRYLLLIWNVNYKLYDYICATGYIFLCKTKISRQWEIKNGIKHIYKTYLL